MKNLSNRLTLAALLSLGFLSFGFNNGVLVAAQQTQRQKTIEKPTPTPKQTATPTVSPTAAPTATPIPTPVPVQTVADLQAKIRQTLTRPDLRRGQIGVKVVSLDTNRTIYEEDAEKYFMPASNMKNYTVAAALEKLSPDFRFVTSVYAAAMPDANGVVRGDLTIYGRGDVSFSQGFDDGGSFKQLNALADKIVGSGVKRIEGSIVGDESYFSGNTIPASWEWDDLQWKSGAEISALPVNDNLVELNVKPSQANSPCYISTLPANTIVKIINRCQTVPAGAAREIRVTKKLDQNTLEVSGTMPVGDQGYQGNVTVSRPAELFVEMLRGILLQKNVIVTGQNKVINQNEKSFLPVAFPTAPIEIARIESAPLGLIAAKTMKPSQNTYTEIILWTLGEQIGRKQEAALATDENSAKKLRKTSSAELGTRVIKTFLTEIGVAPDSVIQWDGSGLSRHNLITPNSVVALYTFMSKSRYADVWLNSLTVGGVDGTLQNRFKGTVAANNARGKTGTIDQVSALSGYVSTRTGERIVFSILVNGVNDVRLRQAAIDEIVVALANFNGKIL